MEVPDSDEDGPLSPLALTPIVTASKIVTPQLKIQKADNDDSSLMTSKLRPAEDGSNEEYSTIHDHIVVKPRGYKAEISDSDSLGASSTEGGHAEVIQNQESVSLEQPFTPPELSKDKDENDWEESLFRGIADAENGIADIAQAQAQPDKHDGNLERAGVSLEPNPIRQNRQLTCESDTTISMDVNSRNKAPTSTDADMHAKQVTNSHPSPTSTNVLRSPKASTAATSSTTGINHLSTTSTQPGPGHPFLGPSLQSEPESTNPPKTSDPRLLQLQSRTAQLEATLSELQASRKTLLHSFASLPIITKSLQTNSNKHESPSNDDEKSAPAKTSALELLTEDVILVQAKKVTQRHIRLLHDYNEIKDVGTSMMGMIAESRGERIKEVQEEFGISKDD